MSLAVIAGLDRPLRQDQLILRMLWDSIKRATLYPFDDGDLESIVTDEPLYTVDHYTY